MTKIISENVSKMSGVSGETAAFHRVPENKDWKATKCAFLIKSSFFFFPFFFALQPLCRLFSDSSNIYARRPPHTHRSVRAQGLPVILLGKKIYLIPNHVENMQRRWRAESCGLIHVSALKWIRNVPVWQKALLVDGLKTGCLETEMGKSLS